ncbi:hypothetical protein SAMN05421776_11557 [Nocardia farcinica]|uniref:Uncharacterized protein n=1 Tax=Nocardia farcinica TaxID=37329 RepID=A0A0H5P4R1_NOCFR|nr:hypothetical protein CJ469_06271 [Nocardia farcinica]SLI52494.1 Uncharacterised protein [Mycobacteroides abscessus subsp. abscessus]PFX01243.1 hypothetical protein CJ468_06131 [Nocardia farcinica]CRY82304.1 Uncharacterised protein [Nocardia farcinica]SIT33383.1 hypothetical protein SAMN05421776_11557 [Nocardia farcinica]
MLNDLPRREPGQSRIPPPKHPVTTPPAPDLVVLTRFATALRQWRDDPGRGRAE